MSNGRRVTPHSMAQLRDLIRRDVEVLQPARDSFANFWKLTKPNMKWGWFYDRLSTELQQFYDDVLAGKQPRLMLCAPPRHGKSEGASRRFPSWVFGRQPGWHVMGCSYGSTLASRMNRDVQRIMDTPLYREIFPSTGLNTQNVATLAGQPLRNAGTFEIVGSLGSYRGAGIGGSITGHGFNIGIIDDPISNAEEALSEVIRESQWEWYRSTFYTRREPVNGIVIMLTRWHEDDLAGRLLVEEKRGGDKWRIVKFPALADEDEPHRAKGEPLVPERFSREELESTQQTVGSYIWACMYQQRPTPRGGVIFDRKDWKYYKALPQLIDIIISVDCTFKDEKHNDYVAIQAWGIDEAKPANKYLLRRLREHMGFTATCKAIEGFKALYPNAIAVIIEDKANGSAVIETLKDKIAGVIAIEPEGGKVARAFAIQPEHEAGNLYIPDPELDLSIELYVGEHASFPGGPHDDEVDATTQAVNWYRARGGAMGMLQFMQAEQKRLQEEREKAAA